MTYLEAWCFACIACTFAALISYVVILIKMEVVKRQKVFELKMKTLSGDSIPENTRDYITESVLFSFTSGGFIVFNFCFWMSLL